ncbi:FMN-dependent NADH-azoreductase, partial [Kitasatospora phosalacinea]|uniref:FMN-dependent NADH-azoreductase n=1 Tax=Kitasatospora phosalacinea TaxID=2065 RepID=UPI003646ED86
MSYLLHIDSSAMSTGSVSRQVAETFLTAWQQENPAGRVVHRDLGAAPVPHLTADGITARFVDAATRTPAQAEAMALQEELVDELLGAGAYLFTVPMYNMSIPSTFKAWLDQIMISGRTIGTPDLPTAGRPAVVVASRGGAYGEGTPRAGWDHAVPFLTTALGGMLGLEVEFVVPELTMAARNPAMAELRPAADASRTRAHEEAGLHAQKIAARLAVGYVGGGGEGPHQTPPTNHHARTPPHTTKPQP